MVIYSLNAETTNEDNKFIINSLVHKKPSFNNSLEKRNSSNLRLIKNYSKYSDNDLIDFFVVNDDELAFNEIFNRYYQKVYGLALKILKDVDKAEDITQEVFVKLLTSAENFRKESKFSTWLYVITKNTINMSFRGLKNSKTAISIDDDIYQKSLDIEISKVNSVSENNPEAQAINKECVEKLYKAVESLPKQSKEVVLLRGRKQYTNLEVAEELGMTLLAVKSRLHRSRKHIKKSLKM